jgi:protein-L-isoaspartate(D-aspartate) O-methyltransferase
MAEMPGTARPARPGPSERASRSDWTLARRRMLERLVADGIDDARVLAAFEAVPRERLVPEALRPQAYRDTALPIGEGQTISAPGIVAAMTSALALEGNETVLEVGTGSGYQAAILSHLAARVISVERVPRLAARARRVLDDLGIVNVLVYLGDGTRGRRADAPFDAIVVTAGGPTIPEPLLEQLAPGGRLVGPFGEREEQRLVRVRREGDGGFREEVIGRCRFVDLIGAHGWVG